jgi:hypothetical protein
MSVSLNGEVFNYVKRENKKEVVGSQDIERTLDGTGIFDYVTNKNNWTFTFNVNQTDLNRLLNVFNLGTSFVLIDSDLVSYNVAWIGNFEPKEIEGSPGNFEIIIIFKQI